MTRRSPRTYEQRCESIKRTLKHKMSITLGMPVTHINELTVLGDSFESILNQVTVAERGTPLKHFGHANRQMTFYQAVEFLVTAIQQ